MSFGWLGVAPVSPGFIPVHVMSSGSMGVGGLSFGAMSALVMLLVAASVLLWPPAPPFTARPPGRALVAAASEGCFGAGVGGGDARTVVPVAEVAGAIDLLALTLRGGVGLVEAMEAVATHVGGPLGRHLQTVAAAGRWGVEDATAWASVPPAWQPAARALRMASAGVPPADALVGAAEEVRRSERQRLEVATATLGVRIVLPLGLVFLPAFIFTTVVPIVLALAQKVLISP